jgi:hypothetical protein
MSNISVPEVEESEPEIPSYDSVIGIYLCEIDFKYIKYIKWFIITILGCQKLETLGPG